MTAERKRATAAEIREFIDERIHETYEIRETRARIHVPLPIRISPDTIGCNWSINIFEGLGEHEEAVRGAVRAGRKRLNLHE